jgi:hypothetical protein
MIAGALALLVVAHPSLATAQRLPSDGTALLQTMHDTYRGHWFTALTFWQRSTTRQTNGTQAVATWYESLRYTPARGTELRIDIGQPAAGNGALYSRDSVWIFRAGHSVSARPGGNALLPLIEGVYVEPLPRVVAALAPTRVDLSRPVVAGTWNGRAVWIAGARTAGDTVSPQFWVDTTDKTLVRAIFSPVPGAPVMDMHLGAFAQTGGGWLATRCEFYVGGTLVQLEEYDDWNTSRALADDLFTPSTWSTARHWAPPPER